MDKEKKDFKISIIHGGYTTCIFKPNITLLELINNLCKEANEQNRVILKAELTVKLPDSILLDNKSL